MIKNNTTKLIFIVSFYCNASDVTDHLKQNNNQNIVNPRNNSVQNTTQKNQAEIDQHRAKTLFQAWKNSRNFTPFFMPK